MLLANVQINYIYQAFTMHKHLQAECCQMFFCFFFLVHTECLHTTTCETAWQPLGSKPLDLMLCVVGHCWIWPLLLFTAFSAVWVAQVIILLYNFTQQEESFSGIKGCWFIFFTLNWSSFLKHKAQSNKFIEIDSLSLISVANY